MTKSELIKKFKDLNIVEENDYLDKYVDIIIQNINTQKERNKTQRHHIIPRAYYSQMNLEIDDSYMNTVNLRYKDHILAHYYLYLCGKGDFKYSNAKAFRYMLNNIDIPTDDKELMKTLEYYEQIYNSKYYKGSMLGKHLTPEQCKKISIARKGGPGTTTGRIGIHKDGNMKYISKDDLDSYLELGWKIGSSKKNTKYLHINNGKINKSVSSDELDQYLEQGWHRGYIKINAKWINKDGVRKHVPEAQVLDYINNGWKFGMK